MMVTLMMAVIMIMMMAARRDRQGRLTVYIYTNEILKIEKNT